MSREKQIREMAADICRVKHNCNDACNPINTCNALKYARRAYEAGYRKQIEVAREIFEDIDGKISCFFPVSSFVKAPNTTHYSLLAMLAELKKKYTEDKT